MSQSHLKVYRLFSPFLRIFHWIMVASIFILFVTGLFITKPLSGGVGIEPTFGSMIYSMELIRNVHFIAAFIFTAAFILRIYGFIINRGDRLFPHFWKMSFMKDTIEVAMHYMLIKSTHKPFLRNPLARGGYAALYVMVLIEMITGYAMYAMAEPNGLLAKLVGWSNGLVGGEFNAHLIHHYFAWFIILFVIVHVYMVIRADIMEGEGEASSMFSGIKILPHEPVDLGDIQKK